MIYRALAESTVFGAKAIIERFREEGIAVQSVSACGGISRKSPFIMQLCADIFNMPVRVSSCDQTCALGGAMFAAAASGIYPNLRTAMD